MEIHLFAIFLFSASFLFVAGISHAVEESPPVNRLAKEKSPYLLQHAHNPVDWYPWGEEAFEKARKEDKPVLLSIGYSTCHWCHVMEDESFSNDKTAGVMNEHFVSIKVDREERPDLDGIYMRYVMAATGGGGWPMTVFLTPDKKPFYGGAYFPPEDRFGMPGFSTLLLSIHDAWKNRREEILHSAQSTIQFLNSHSAKADPVGATQRVAPTEEVFRSAFGSYSGNFDSAFGGFGRAPKFPMGHALSWLLRYYARTHDEHALTMAEATLKAMAAGGMYDRLGGGFHRYSTDREWRVPHFEKMLYDQALLVRPYLEAYQITKDPLYARIARETLDYVLRRMTGRDGGFFSAEDADSPDPSDPKRKREGAFYVWKKNEIEKALTKDEAEAVIDHYGILEEGNAIQDPHHEFTNQNVLYEARASGEKEKLLAAAREKLSSLREKRPKPHLDDKVLTDWNGLMIASFAFASQALDEPRYAEAATRAAEFISKNLKDKDGRLLHRYRDRDARIDGMLDDYAFLIYGYLELYQAVFDERWLKEAKDLAGRMIDLFWDKESKGFFSASGAPDLIARLKDAYDGAIPSGNSMATLDLLLLGRITGESKYEEHAREILKAFSVEVAAQPTGHALMLSAADFAFGPSYEIVIALDEKGSHGEEILKEIRSGFLPNKVVILRKAGKDSARIETLAPFTKEQAPIDGQTTVFICRNGVCELPLTRFKDVHKKLQSTFTEKTRA